jgi:hypothetical protein
MAIHDETKRKGDPPPRSPLRAPRILLRPSHSLRLSSDDKAMAAFVGLLLKKAEQQAQTREQAKGFEQRESGDPDQQ